MANNRLPMLLVAIAVNVALAGCENGDGGESPRGNQGVSNDSLNACTLATREELTAAFGEPSGEPVEKNQTFLRACHIDGQLGKVSALLTVVRPPNGAKDQYDYDKTTTENVKTIEGLGQEAFWYVEDIMVKVVVLDGEVLLSAAIFHSSIADMPEPTLVLDRLKTLAGHMTQRV